MKSFSLIALTVFAAISTVFAAPLPTISDLDARYSGDEDTEFLERRAPPSASAQTAITWMGTAANKAAINAKPLCFYSGFTEVYNTQIKKSVPIKAHGKLAAFMQARGCNSIDNIVSLTGQSVAAKKWATDPDWLAVSKALAQNVSGTVYVLLGKTVPAESVWLKTEKAALVANAAVTTVEIYEIATNGDMVKVANLKG